MGVGVQHVLGVGWTLYAIKRSMFSMKSGFRTGFVDLYESLRRWRLWSLLGWLEIRQRYTRSKVGPFWLTISMGVLVATLGVVYGSLFGQKLADYLPMIAIGIVMWGLLSGIVNEGCLTYIASANYIRQVQSPRFLYVMQVIWRNLIILAHNLVIIVVVLFVFGVRDAATLPLFVPGFFLFVVNAAWLGALSGLVAARYRDVPQIVAALLQVAFYVTPILFQGRMLAGRHQWIVTYNPLAYLIDIVREPLLGQSPSLLSWEVAAAMAVAGWLATLLATGRLHARIPFWV
jgi:lipopolysaccharide transport system permease protein